MNLNKEPNNKDELKNSQKTDDNILMGEEIFVKQIMEEMEDKQKSKRTRHISFNLDNNIIISYKTEELITDFEITKEGEEDIIPFKRDFSLYLKILKRKFPPNPIIKQFDKNEIKINKEYTLMENLDEQQIIPDLYEENEEDIKSLEKSLEKSIDKSFDKSYERSVNISVNQSYNQSINQSYNQSITQSYMENSFNRNNSRIGVSTGGGLIQKLTKVFNEGINEDKDEFEENDKEEENEHDNDDNKEEKNNGDEENEEEENEEEREENEEEKEENEEREEEEEEEEEKEDNSGENKDEEVNHNKKNNDDEEDRNDDEEQEQKEGEDNKEKNNSDKE